MKSRFGVMRGRQFMMKDLYTFDIDVEKAKETYETICDTYDKIFRVIEIPVTKGKLIVLEENTSIILFDLVFSDQKYIKLNFVSILSFVIKMFSTKSLPSVLLYGVVL